MTTPADTLYLIPTFIGFFTFGFASAKWIFQRRAEQAINAMRIANDAHIDHIYKMFEENKK